MNFLQRLAARIFFGSHSVFESANRSPRRAEVPGSGPRDTSLDLTPGVRSELVRRSRYLVKNSGFLQEIVGSMAMYSIGDGIMPQPASKDDAWNKHPEEESAGASQAAPATQSPRKDPLPRKASMSVEFLLEI